MGDMTKYLQNRDMDSYENENQVRYSERNGANLVILDFRTHQLETIDVNSNFNWTFVALNFPFANYKESLRRNIIKTVNQN